MTKRGEQYRGFLAIEATAAPAGFARIDDATAFLLGLAGDEREAHQVKIGNDLRGVLRAAQRSAHPDAGGDAATFQRVSLAEAKLREEGLV
ncbi:hypothetical protein [Microbacterium sp. CH12i]|uniref:hypothetical protein n=1 Tax=Microbacterium sp. CH12i TaxID=1479651 RepID=UPI0006918730|nr:hypothetical protein [Microbacterium sp. CH12i]